MNDILNKLTRYALDAAATDHESAAAWGRILELARKRGMTAAELASAIAGSAAAAPSTVEPPTTAGQTILRFGKFKGRTLGDVAATDPDYLRWLLSCKNLHRETRAAVECVLAEQQRQPA